jgi:hypothetical protein
VLKSALFQVDQLDDKLLKEYADKFFGFGNRNAPVWFVGIEEAGGWGEQDVRRRLDAWKIEKRDLEDAPAFYPSSENHRWHGEGAQLQGTWEQLVKLLLVAQGKPDTSEAILKYQRECFGRLDGETCLVELLPLPSPSINEWRYSNWSEARWLKSRDRYYAHLLVPRAAALARRIQMMQPSFVIFYGTTFLQTWSSIAGGAWSQAIPGKLVTFSTGHTIFYVTKHPADPQLEGTRNDYFREVGDYLRREHGSRFAAVIEKSEKARTAKIKPTASLTPARLDWPSVIGNFMLNFGVLDLHVLDSLESRLTPETFAMVRGWHLRDRLDLLKQHLPRDSHSKLTRERFERFFERLEPIRELRNHIAHGTMRLGLTADSNTWEVTLSLPRDLDASNSPEARHVTFEELDQARNELGQLIEEFEELDGMWIVDAKKVRF